MSSSSAPGGMDPDLTELRASIDVLDEELLHLIQKRMAVVERIAEFKRAHSVPVRDLEREKRVLSDRRALATRLGLDPATIESIARLLLLSSRDRQTKLRVEVPQDAEPKTIAVVGAHGGMGACVTRLFSDLGHKVLAVDRDTKLAAAAAAAQSDVVVISVPIDVTEEVIASVGPHIREEALLMDVTSLKQAPMGAMLAATKASVVGTHPMFGPSVHTLQGQRIVLCAGRGEDWHRWASETFRARGLVVTEASAREHDRMMAVVQVLNHYQTQVLGWTMSKLGVSVEETLAFRSPAYLLETYVTARHFAQSPDLYGPIEMRNPSTAEVTEAFGEAARELREILLAGDRRAFDAMFNDVRGYFGELTAEAVEQSQYLIDRLIELSAGR